MTIAVHYTAFNTTTNINSITTVSLVPRLPFNTAIGKGGLVNIVQHFCKSGGILGGGQSDWLMWQLSHCTELPYRKPLTLLITPLQTSLAHLQFTEAQQETSKASLLAESIAIASPWCEAVLYSPDPPSLFGGGSGNETK